jgi:hypothetical protein
MLRAYLEELKEKVREKDRLLLERRAEAREGAAREVARVLSRSGSSRRSSAISLHRAWALSSEPGVKPGRMAPTRRQKRRGDAPQNGSQAFGSGEQDSAPVAPAPTRLGAAKPWRGSSGSSRRASSPTRRRQRARRQAKPRERQREQPRGDCSRRGCRCRSRGRCARVSSSSSVGRRRIRFPRHAVRLRGRVSEKR